MCEISLWVGLEADVFSCQDLWLNILKEIGNGYKLTADSFRELDNLLKRLKSPEQTSKPCDSGSYSLLETFNRLSLNDDASIMPSASRNDQ